MTKFTFIGAALASMFIGGAALADDDCTDPVADWQPREVLRQQLEEQGWSVRRIKVDDGCYEAKGTDHNGNRFKAKYWPASLHIYKLKVKFDKGGTAADYLGRAKESTANSDQTTQSNKIESVENQDE